VEFAAADAQDLRVTEGEPRGDHHLNAGDTIEISGAGPVEFHAGGGGVVRVTENHDAARREERLRIAQDRVAAIGMELTQAEKEDQWLERDAATRAEELAGLEREIAHLQSAASANNREGTEEAALRWRAAEAALEKVLAERAKLPQASSDRDRLRRELQAAEEAARKTRDRILEEQAVLRRMTAGGPYEKLAAAEERLTSIEDRLAAERLRMNAVSLLWRTIEQCKNEALEGLHEPVGREAAALLARMTGLPGQQVRLTGEFQPVQVSDFHMDELSGGEAEQVYLATRLALARHLAHGMRQLVVLDDVLTATDPRRLERIVELLREESSRLQFLILTCHPDRYRRLGTVWELPAQH
jgi:uncharacterized protein YhaN